MRLRSIVIAGALVGSVAAPSLARAGGNDAIGACVTATQVGQEQQRAGKLGAARSTFVKCDEAICPVEVRSVCERLLVAAEASQPSIVLSARDDAGRDLVDAAVSLDGAPIAGGLDGKALDVDPGIHDVRFVTPDGRIQTLRVVAHEGEKNRAVQATFGRQVTPKTPPSDETPEKQASSRSAVPVLSYVFGAVGIAALGAFGVLGFDGQRRYGDCHDHGCAPSTVDGLALERGIAWTALGVGVVSLGAATVFFFDRPTASGNVSVGMRGSGLFFAESF